MKRVLDPLSWAFAVVVAVAIARRVKRGRRVVLTGRFSPRLVRMIAMVLVLFGIGCEKRRPTGGPVSLPIAPVAPSAGLDGSAASKVPDACDALPDAVTSQTVEAWARHQEAVSGWSRFKLDVTRALPMGRAQPHPAGVLPTSIDVSPAFAAMVAGQIAALAEGRATPAVTPAEALRALDEMEAKALYDHWLNAYLWRRTATADPAGVHELYTRFVRHARIADTLIAAYGQVRPLLRPPRAWMSKAAPPRERAEDRAAREQAVQDFFDAVKRLYPTTDAGTWRRDGVTLLSPVKGVAPPMLLRGGQRLAFADGEKTRVGRLDLLVTPKDSRCALTHDWLGPLELPADRTVSVWGLETFLSPGGTETARAAIAKALDGDEKTAEQLERALPLVHRSLRAALEKSPGKKGAPRLRMIMALFDDVPMPPLPAVGADGGVDSGFP